jgi:hypothetical protein
MSHHLSDHYPEELRQVREGDFSPVFFSSAPQDDDAQRPAPKNPATGTSGSRGADNDGKQPGSNATGTRSSSTSGGRSGSESGGSNDNDKSGQR